MDGYEQMVETGMWKALKQAQDAVYAAQEEFRKSGFATDRIFQAGLLLTGVENGLRQYFKDKAAGE